MLVLCWASVTDGGPDMDQHWINVLCLLGVLTVHICVLHITGCEDIKNVAQLIEPTDHLVTVDHLPGCFSNIYGEKEWPIYPHWPVYIGPPNFPGRHVHHR